MATYYYNALNKFKNDYSHLSEKGEKDIINAASHIASRYIV